MTPSMLPVIQKLDDQQCCRRREIQRPVGNGTNVAAIESNRCQAEESVNDPKGGPASHDVFEITNESSPRHLPRAAKGKEKLQRDQYHYVGEQERCQDC